MKRLFLLSFFIIFTISCQQADEASESEILASGRDKKGSDENKSIDENLNAGDKNQEPGEKKRVCTPGEGQCSGQIYQVCNEEGSSFEVVEDCAKGESSFCKFRLCNALKGCEVSQKAEGTTCDNKKACTEAVCNSEGKCVDTTAIDCGFSKFCNEETKQCQFVICSPGEVECQGTDLVTCDSLGKEYLEKKECKLGCADQLSPAACVKDIKIENLSHLVTQNKVELSWKAALAQTQSLKFRIERAKDSLISGPLVQYELKRNDGFSDSKNLSPDTVYYYRIFMEENGILLGPSDVYMVPYKLDGLKVLSTSPGDGEKNIKPSNKFKITFSEEVDPQLFDLNSSDSICKGDVQISYDDFRFCAAFSGTPTTFDNKSFEFTLKEDLKKGRRYKVKVLSSLKAKSGNRLKNQFQMTAGFLTEYIFDPKVDGKNGFGAIDELNTTNSAIKAFVRWDIDYLYLAYEGKPLNSLGPDYKFVIYLSSENPPVSTKKGLSLISGSFTPAMEIPAQFALIIDADFTNAKLMEFDGSDWILNKNLTATEFKGNNDFIEARVKLSDLGAAAFVNLHMSIVSTLANGSILGGVPSSSFKLGTVNPDYEKYFRFDLSSNKPVGAYTPRPVVFNDLIFSEYIEGSSNNKALEIFNGTANDIDLADYKLVKRVNGNNDSEKVFKEIIKSGQALVICNSQSNSALKAVCDVAHAFIGHNGNDSYRLFKVKANNQELIDSFGDDKIKSTAKDWSTGAVSTRDMTLRRKCGTQIGDLNFQDPFIPATEWDAFAIDDFSDLQKYSCP